MSTATVDVASFARSAVMGEMSSWELSCVLDMSKLRVSIVVGGGLIFLLLLVFFFCFCSFAILVFSGSLSPVDPDSSARRFLSSWVVASSGCCGRCGVPGTESDSVASWVVSPRSLVFALRSAMALSRRRCSLRSSFSARCSSAVDGIADGGSSRRAFVRSNSSICRMAQSLKLRSWYNPSLIRLTVLA